MSVVYNKEKKVVEILVPKRICEKADHETFKLLQHDTEIDVWQYIDFVKSWEKAKAWIEEIDQTDEVLAPEQHSYSIRANLAQYLVLPCLSDDITYTAEVSLMISQQFNAVIECLEYALSEAQTRMELKDFEEEKRT